MGWIEKDNHEEVMEQWNSSVIYHAEIQDIEIFYRGSGGGKCYRGNVLITRSLSTEIVTIKEEEPIVPST